MVFNYTVKQLNELNQGKMYIVSMLNMLRKRGNDNE